MNQDTKHSIHQKLSQLTDLLLDSGTQEQLDIVEDIIAFDLAYDDNSELERLKEENEVLKQENARYKRVYGNAVMERTRWA